MTSEEICVDIEPERTCDIQPKGDPAYMSLIRTLESFRISMQDGYGSIYRVHSHLRKVNDEAYEPEIVAIGPYHHGKEKLAMMEKHKVRYLHNLLDGKGGNVGRYIKAIRKHEEKVRNFYAEPLSSLSDGLVEMMVLDGCFIIELLSKSMPFFGDPNDPIFKTEWMMNSIQRDLMLFENQLPFVVLLELFRMVEEAQNDQRFIKLLLDFFEGILPDPDPRWSKAPEYSLDTVKHLLDFVHINWLPPPFQRDKEIGKFDSCSNRKSLIMLDWLPLLFRRGEEIQNSESGSNRRSLIMLNWLPRLFLRDEEIQNSESGSNRRSLIMLNWLRRLFRRDEEIKNSESDSNRKSLIMRSATELREAGVKFEKVKGDHFFDISFTNGTLKIPTIEINDTTEAFLKNLIAREQYSEYASKEMYVTAYNWSMDDAYTWFMDDYLINTRKDVEILRRHGIILNLLGDDGIVSDIFNKIGDSVTGSIGRYEKVAKDLNSHCNKRRHSWMVVLRHDIIPSPWAIISVIVGAILLVLIAVQTTCTIFACN